MLDGDPMNSPAVCALTGSTGYVGSVLTAALSSMVKVVPLTRREGKGDRIQWDFNSGRDISGELRDRKVEVLVHAAWDMRANTLDELRRTAVAGSERLYSAAARAGVKRIVFISTISAFEGCRSAYGRSKLEVEQMTRAQNGVVLRPGLVYGPTPGGVFGAIRGQVQGGKIIPLIGNGRAPQFLLHEDTLKEVARRAVAGDFPPGEPITVAHPQPWPFRDLVQKIAEKENRKVTLAPAPWPLLYAGLRFAEMLKVKLPVRSDSIISFVYQNPSPDFSKLSQYGIHPMPFGW
jgi:nucleoside-diphosphate-sugar epimerase